MTSRSKDSISDAVSYSIRLLSIRGRSEKELKERLTKKGFNQGTMEKAIDVLRGYGYINDRRLAERLISYAFTDRKLGRRGTTSFLHKRGIPVEIITESGIESLDERPGAEELVRKKAPRISGLPEDKKKRRLYGMLSRRGYSSETISYVLKKVDL